jgi:DNA adenine methylase
MGTRTGEFPSEAVFDEARKRLANAEISVADYKTTLTRIGDGDFVYIDPPYSKSGRFTGEYGLGSFDSSELPEFFENLAELDRRGAKFLFSYRACEETRELLSEYYQVEVIPVKRHVSGFKESWNDSKEILVKNYGQ